MRLTCRAQVLNLTHLLCQGLDAAQQIVYGRGLCLQLLIELVFLDGQLLTLLLDSLLKLIFLHLHRLGLLQESLLETIFL